MVFTSVTIKKVWLSDRQTHARTHTHRQTPDKVIPMCRYASQATQKSMCVILTNIYLVTLKHWQTLRKSHWDICHYDLDLRPFAPKIYRYPPLFILHLGIKVKVPKNIWVIALKQFFDRWILQKNVLLHAQIDIDRVITVGLRNLWWQVLACGIKYNVHNGILPDVWKFFKISMVFCAANQPSSVKYFLASFWSLSSNKMFL